ncbi:MAG: fatty acid desaturase [Burkholderiaceae bacterium]|nr:fatty acid desaturase [Burkholderiaceae bacterium]
MSDSLLAFLDRGLLDAAWWQIVVYTLAITHVTIVAVTLFLHRCQAHRALDLHPAVSHFFRFWLWLTTGMVTREWAAVHRKHHAKCETAEDPHSPVQRGLRTVLLEGTELYRAEAANPETVRKYGHGTPDDWLERRLYARHTMLGVYLTLAISVALFGAIGLTIWAVQMAWIPLFAAGVINGLGHHSGYRNFQTEDASTNILPWGILIGGEELHNNHHAYGSSAKLSSKWYEFDIGWLYIRLLSMLGLARVRRVAPRPKFGAARPAIDFDTLQAVILHRYDVMARYARSLRRACAEEARRLARLERPEGRLVASARRWLPLDASRWSEHHKARLAEIFAASERLRKLVEMRNELAAVWERSNLSREQLVAHLQQWCQRAEASGVRALQEMSVRVRSYAV